MNYPITGEKEKKLKYKNEKIEIDNIKFDSKKEAKRYVELKQQEQAGIIKDLKLQVPFELQPSYKKENKTIRAINYVCDFTYIDNNGKFIVEDVKGFINEVYKLKKKMFEFKYGVEIKEV